MVTNYDHEQARDPKLQEVIDAWEYLPLFLRDGIANTVRDALEEFGESQQRALLLRLQASTDFVNEDPAAS